MNGPIIGKELILNDDEIDLDKAKIIAQSAWPIVEMNDVPEREDVLRVLARSKPLILVRNYAVLVAKFPWIVNERAIQYPIYPSIERSPATAVKYVVQEFNYYREMWTGVKKINPNEMDEATQIEWRARVKPWIPALNVKIHAWKNLETKVKNNPEAFKTRLDYYNASGD